MRRNDLMKTISILGSTGSIGCSTMEVIAQHRNSFSIKILAAHNNFKLLAQQAKDFLPENVVILNEEHYEILKKELSGYKVAVHAGMDALLELLKDGQDVVLSALMGIAGLRPTYASLGCCNILALANKEALICAGSLIKQRASITSTQVIPVDSEHSAIHQVLMGQERSMLKSITLTASGGPFRQYSLQQMKDVTISTALQHPSWKMGAKITIDSATLFNKGLEFIEAMYLFDVNARQIEIVVHPQSIIHSLVTYKDGSTLAQLSRPTMHIPIAYAINFPNRLEIMHESLRLAALSMLSFEEPDLERFPLLGLAIKVADSGQAAQIIANCANEYAVAAFLAGNISFLDIYKTVDMALQNIPPVPIDSLHDVLALQASTERWCMLK